MTLGESFDGVLGAARAGAPWASERLWRDLAPVVAGYMRVQGASEPDDVTSDVFLNAFTHLASFHGGEDRFRAWVFTIAHHRLVDERRRLARHPVPTGASPETLTQVKGGDVEDDAFVRLSDERVGRLCAALVPDQRDVVLLRMVGGMSLEQTAEALGKSVGAVKALQHRAMAALRRHLDREAVSR